MIAALPLLPALCHVDCGRDAAQDPEQQRARGAGRRVATGPRAADTHPPAACPHGNGRGLPPLWARGWARARARCWHCGGWGWRACPLPPPLPLLGRRRGPLGAVMASRARGDGGSVRSTCPLPAAKRLLPGNWRGGAGCAGAFGARGQPGWCRDSS